MSTTKKLTKVKIKDVIKLHLKWVYGEKEGLWADLSGADLSWANLSGADLSGADLSGANLWMTQWPLWCGTKKVKIGIKIVRQLAAHFCTCECEEPEFQEARKVLMPLALKSHVAKDLELS